jgi:hypothetical protein
MSRRRGRRGGMLWTLSRSVPLLAAGYAAYVAGAWLRYGRSRSAASPRDVRPQGLVDRFMPVSDVAEVHEVRVEAPVECTFATACDMDLNRSWLVRTVFALRALPSRLRGHDTSRPPRPILDETLALGWRVLARIPGREIVLGAVTQPWRGEVTFRGIEPDAFLRFSEPGYAKIVWTLEAEAIGEAASRFRTQTRVITTDPGARRLFRRYWAALSPGILLIRRESLRLVKAEAERRYRASNQGEAASVSSARSEGRSPCPAS